MTTLSSAQEKRGARSKFETYRSKRDFKKTREPSGGKSRKASGHCYLIQKHAASRLRWSHFLTQPAKVGLPMQRTNHYEDTETVFG
jgi:hypothetical protein